MQQSSAQKGFSLIEMIVSVAIFSVVSIAAASALLSVIDSNERTQALTETNNNLNFALQTMVREIRNGYNYGCDASDGSSVGGCSNPDSQFGFINANRNEAGFQLSDSQIVDEAGNAITPEEVEIDTLDFRLTGADQNNEQSRVEISITARSNIGGEEKVLNLHTSATQRLLYTPTN